MPLSTNITVKVDSFGKADFRRMHYSNTFSPAGEDFGFEPSLTYWMKFSILNEFSFDKELYLNLDRQKNFNYGTIYLFHEGTLLDSTHVGTYVHEGKLKYPKARFYYKFFAQKGEKLDFLLKMRNINHYPLRWDMNIKEAEDQWNHQSFESIFIILFFGCLLVLAVYNLLLIIFFQQRIYLYYFLYLIAAIVFSMYQNDFLFRLLGDFPKLPPLLNVLSEDSIIILYCLFVCDFFCAKYKFRKAYTLMKGVMLFSATKMIVNTFLMLSDMNLYAADLIVLLPLIPTLLVVAYCLYLFSDTYAQSKWYLISGSIALLLSAILAATLGLLIIFGKIDMQYRSISILVEIGILIEALCFSLALAKRNKEAEVARRDAQNKVITIQQENTLSLERKVHQRTEELSAMNEELQQQSEEISTVNENLENIVNTRTEQLQAAVETLQRQNENLEQFSYIVSHNIRGPLTRILGLTDLFNLVPVEDREEIIVYLINSAQDLAVLAHDLTTILEVRNKKEISYESFDIAETVSGIMDDLKVLNPNLPINITYDFASQPTLISNKAYIEDIFFHLLSNAIKFRHPERELDIRVSAHMDNNEICLSVKDNGLGLDLDNTNLYKIFGLYQRMHEHREGKGLGLFLVKTKVEALEGKIVLESEVNSGSIFKIYLKVNT